MHDGTRDTVIQMTNITDNPVRARCFYVDPLCHGTGFYVDFTVRQPLHWVVSPVFQGEMLCVAVDGSGVPLPTNAFVGEATIENLASGDTTKYNAIGIRATGQGEYDPCPDKVSFPHFAYAAQDPLIGGGSSVRTNITVVPCSRDLANQTQISTTLDFTIVNEFEQAFVTSTTVTCWADLPLNAISSQFNASFLGGTFAQTIVQPAPGSGFLMVVEEFHDVAGAEPITSSAAIDVHVVP